MVIQPTSLKEEYRLLHLLESKRVLSRPMEPVFIVTYDNNKKFGKGDFSKVKKFGLKYEDFPSRLQTYVNWLVEEEDPASNPALINSELSTTIACTLSFGKSADGSDEESIADNLDDFSKACNKAAGAKGKKKMIYLF